MISHENRILSDTMMGVETPIPPFTMNAAAPEGTPPRRISYVSKKHSCPAVPRRGPEAKEPSQNYIVIGRFSWFGCELPVMSISPEQKSGKLSGRSFVRSALGEFTKLHGMQH
jgi:hypothetical protein